MYIDLAVHSWMDGWMDGWMVDGGWNKPRILGIAFMVCSSVHLRDILYIFFFLEIETHL